MVHEREKVCLRASWWVQCLHPTPTATSKLRLCFTTFRGAFACESIFLVYPQTATRFFVIPDVACTSMLGVMDEDGFLHAPSLKVEHVCPSTSVLTIVSSGFLAF